MTTANFTGDTVGAIALIAVLAFVIDRVVSTVLFLLSFNNAWSQKFPDPILIESGRSQIRAEKKQRLIYLLMALLLSLLVILSFGRMSILPALGVEYPQNQVTGSTSAQSAPQATNPPSPRKSDTTLENVPIRFVLLDIFLTTLLLVGGADRMGQLVRMIGGTGSIVEKSEPKPLQVSGRLILDGERFESRPSSPAPEKES